MEKTYKTFIIKIILAIAILTAGCDREDQNDKIINFKVIDDYRQTSIKDVQVKVVKSKHIFLFEHKDISTQIAHTDSMGECSIMIKNYNPEKYTYIIGINMNNYDKLPPNDNDNFYSRQSIEVHERHFIDPLIVRLTKIF